MDERRKRNFQHAAAAGIGAAAADGILSHFLGPGAINVTLPLFFSAGYLYLDGIRSSFEKEIGGLHNRLQELQTISDDEHLLREMILGEDPVFGRLVDVARRDVDRGFASAQRYRGEIEIYVALKTLIDMTSRGGVVRTGCTHKNWDSPALEAYFRACADAVNERGVNFTRIFALYEPKARQEAKSQKLIGIRTRVIAPADFERISVRFGFHRSVGFAIFEGRGVFVHAGIDEAATGWWMECPAAVGMLNDLYRHLDIAATDP